MLDKLEKLFQEVNIYKSLFICNDERINEVVNQLQKNNHAVYKYTNGFNTTYIKEFNTSNYRILVINYETWIKYSFLIQEYVLPYQNLIILNEINDYEISKLKKWINESVKSGFISSNKESYILNMNAD